MRNNDVSIKTQPILFNQSKIDNPSVKFFAIAKPKNSITTLSYYISLWNTKTIMENMNMRNLVEPIKDKKQVKAVEEYLKSYSKRNQLIFIFGINTGLRVSDILDLDISDVKNRSYVEIREKKTGKYKRFPLNEKLKKLIKEYLKEREKRYSIGGNEALFIGKKHCRLNRSQVYRFLNEACKKLNISINVGTHTMRKTFGYHHYKQFNDIALLQKILNHSSPSITLKYIGIEQETIDISYNNFEL